MNLKQINFKNAFVPALVACIIFLLVNAIQVRVFMASVSLDLPLLEAKIEEVKRDLSQVLQTRYTSKDAADLILRIGRVEGELQVLKNR